MKTIIKGFKNQSIITIDELLSLLEVIPAHHKQKIKNIVYDPSRFFQRSYAQPRSLNPKVSAQYSTLPWAFIVIYHFHNKTEFRHMLYHEIGHHVYRFVLSSSLKKQWVTQIYPEQNFISEYAATNAAEDFAETYSFFFHSPQLCAKFPKKYKFIQTI